MEKIFMRIVKSRQRRFIQNCCEKHYYQFENDDDIC